MNYKIYTRSLAAINGSDDDGVYRGISVITCGPCLGHNCVADRTTLEQMLACAKKYPNGIKAQLNHFSGIEAVFGVIKNFRISGDKLLGDLTLFKEHPDFALTKRQIESLSDNIGFSAFFSGDDEVIGGTHFCRVEELHSIDLCTSPAANPSGVFSRWNHTDSRPITGANFMKYHTTSYHLSYRKFRTQGMGKKEALKASQKSNWSDYVEYCRLQENGTVMESLDAPDYERNLSIIRSGRLM